MSDPKLRREIALRAAQLMYTRDEQEYFAAKRKAARQLVGDDRIRDLPSNREVREHILLLSQLLEGESRGRNLQTMRLHALRFMRLLSRFRPKLIGSVLTGHIRKNSDIDLHVFSNSDAVVSDALENAGFVCRTERKRVSKFGEERVFTHIHVDGEFPIELSVYAESKASFVFKSSITLKAIERATVPQLEEFLRNEYPGIDLDAELERMEAEEVTKCDDRMEALDYFRLLLAPLEGVKQNPKYHPEGDALFHSLQVFQLAFQARSWDEELVIAALLHDVGKGIDNKDHVNAGLEALDGYITERTRFLIAHHMEAPEYKEGTLGQRAKARLAADENFEDLMLLQECDAGGRVRGAQVPTLEEVFAILAGFET